jgi:endoglucanase
MLASGRSLASHLITMRREGMSKRWLDIARELLSLPTAPLLEDSVAAWVRAFTCRRRLDVDADTWGNLLVRYRRGPATLWPLVFCAHMDHPGFEAQATGDDGLVAAAWRGHAPVGLFRDAAVRFFSNGRWVRGRIVEVQDRQAPASARAVRVAAASPVEPGSPGMWDFPAPRLRGSRLYARGLDDVAGVAAILCLLDEACRRRLSADFMAFFTRAEECGFLGAIGACRDRLLPDRSIHITLESSSALPNAKVGDGVVVRVGDRMSIFSPEVTAMLAAAAADLARRDRQFRFQRRLMDGGSCETTVYAAYGYESGALSLPIGNAHNVDRRRDRLAPEFMDMRDFDAAVKFMRHLVASGGTHPPDLRDEFEASWSRHGKALLGKRTA